ncbi:MAG: hypothetical protein CMJ31_06770 [Phycisphaerae bacterium]|nr:hypothetical protein [Phycisphaerae bacterium]
MRRRASFSSIIPSAVLGFAIAASSAAAGPGFNVGIHLGTTTSSIGGSGSSFVGDYCYPYYRGGYAGGLYWPGTWGVSSGSAPFGTGYVPYGRYGYPASTTFVVSPTRRIIWPPQPAQPVDDTADEIETMSPIEAAWDAMANRAPAVASDLFRLHIEDAPDDLDALRGLAFAMMSNDRLPEGVALLRQVYVEDPRLAARVVDVAHLGGRAAARDTLVAAVRHAHEVGSSSAWFAVAVLMQAEGRDDRAIAMLNRAAAEALEPEIVLAMRAELGR